MTTTRERERDAAQERDRRKGQIGEQVLHTLGVPAGLYRVQVHQLWDDHYRVNVLTGADAASYRVAHSYFLVANSDGVIVASRPELAKRY